MAEYIELDKKNIKHFKQSASMFQDDIVCSVNTDFMQKVAEAENKLLYEMLKEFEKPVADVVPVVRCRDCKHYDGDFCNNDQWWNDDSYITVDDDDFCSYGERKDQNG